MRNKHHMRGSVLIVAMVVLFALAAMALTLGRNARVDLALAANSTATREADAIARGAEQYVLSILTNYRDQLDDLTEADFEKIPVGDGYFWITRPTYDDDTLSAYGLVDETSKLNLKVASYESLRALPGMTDEIAGAIVDWRDEDDNPTANGAESGTYLSRPDGYRAKNATFEAVEELLLVNGMTRELLYGPPASASNITTDYYQLHGLADFFTVWGGPSNTAADGTARADINTQRTDTRRILREKISDSRGDAIMNAVGTRPLIDIFHLAVLGGMTYDELVLVSDYLAVRPLQSVINVNTAPREVLLTLPGIGESDVEALLARRSSEISTNPTSTAWVFNVLKDKSVGVGNFITGRGRQFSADIVAASRDGRAFKHIKIVVDTSPTTPRIVYRRDLTDRGWPLDQTILASLKSTQGGTRK